MTREDLRLRRLLALWAPLALTFLLLSGGTPVVNKSINRLEGVDNVRELAGYSLLLGFAVFAHSPLLVTREIAIKLSVDAAGMRLSMWICGIAGASVAALELLLGFTPLGAFVLGRFTDDRALIESAHRALPLLAPMPLLVAIRGVYQAQEIRAENTLLVGLGTLCRLAVTALLGVGFGNALELPGPSLGAFLMSVGITVETLVGVLGTRYRMRRRPAPAPGVRHPKPVRFALALMLANALGVAALVFHLRIAGEAVAAWQAPSLAAHQEVRSAAWFLTAGAIALQSMTTAKAGTPEGARAMLRFACGVGLALTALFALLSVPAVRELVFVRWLDERSDGPVVELLAPALAVGALLPLLQAVRFALRGILLARGATKAITMTTVLTLFLLSLAFGFELYPAPRNGALNTAIWWAGTLVVECAVLARYALFPRPVPEGLPAPVRSPRESTAG